MFNGIIEVVGAIATMRPARDGAILMLNSGNFYKKLKPGDSIAMDGVCLTVVRKERGLIRIDISTETWTRTNLHLRKQGDPVNLELPVTGATMISGHFVQGHVEGTAKVKELSRKKMDVRLRLELPAHLSEYCVEKGSIALNGVSLTIATMKGRSIEIALIPYTLEQTNLGALQRGDEVNVETDILGRYVVSYLKTAYHKNSQPPLRTGGHLGAKKA